MEAEQQVEKIRQIVTKDNDLRDARLTRLENQQDAMNKQLTDLLLQNRDILGLLKAADRRMEDFIKTNEAYVKTHNDEHCRLQDTDEQLKKYMWIFMGAVGLLSFAAPYIWQIILKN